MMRERETRTEIRLAGFGGQGVILAGVLLGQAAVNDGRFAAGSNSYGAQARGSACKAELVISESPIDYPHVECPDLFLAMSQGGYDAFKRQASKDTSVLFDSGLVQASGFGGQEQGFDAAAAAVKVLKNKQVANVIWIGVVGGITGWFSEEALEEAVSRHVPERFLELNRRALAYGLALGRGQV